MVALYQFFQAFGRILQLVLIINEGEITVVKRHEGIVFPAAGYVNGVVCYTTFGKQFGLCGGFQKVVIQTQHDVGFAVFSFHAQAVKQRDAIFQRDQFQLAIAVSFKGFFDCWARAPVSCERVVGIDGQYRFGEDRRCAQQ